MNKCLERVNSSNRRSIVSALTEILDKLIERFKFNTDQQDHRIYFKIKVENLPSTVVFSKFIRDMRDDENNTRLLIRT